MIDAKKFAALTAALAASVAVGCSDTTDSGDDDGSSSGGTSSSSGDVSSSSGGSSSGGSSGASSSSGGSSGSSSGGSSSGGSSSGGVECLGDDGAAPTCEDLTGCLTDEFHDGMCEGYAAVFRPEVAKAAIDCLMIAPTCEAGDDESGCAADAVEQACAPDIDVDTYCTGVAESAGCEVQADADAIKASCMSFAPALTALGREGLSACVADYQCDFAELCTDPSYAWTVLSPQL